MRSSSLSNYINSRNHDSVMCILPTVLNDVKYANVILKKIVPALHRLESHPKADLYGLYGCERNLCIPGYRMDPKTLPPINEHLIGFQQSKEFLDITAYAMKSLYDKLDYYLCERPYTIRRIANSGYPDMTSDIQAKTQLVNNILTHINDICSLVSAKSYTALFDKYHISNTAIVRERSQTDSVKAEWNNDVLVKATVKERKSTIDNHGTTVIANRTINRFPPFCFAKRIRTVLGISLPLNCLPNIVANAMTDCLINIAPHTFHVGSPLIELRDNQDEYKSRIPMSFDVQQFDSNVDPMWIATFVEVLYQLGVRKEICDISLATLSPAWIMSGIWKDPKKNVQHPYHGGETKAWDVNYLRYPSGLPSGSAYTSVLGKTYMSSLVFTTLVHMGILQKDQFLQFLNHDVRIPVWLWNQSDDNLLWVQPSVVDKLQNFPSVMNSISSNIRIDFDKHPTYLSHNIVKNDEGIWHAYPDAMRAASNILSPEVGFHMRFAYKDGPTFNKEALSHWYGLVGKGSDEMISLSQKYPAYGYFQRNDLYSQTNPVWNDVIGSIESIFKIEYPLCYTLLHQLADVESECVARITVNAINDAEAHFLLHPETIHYRYAWDDIRDSIRTLHYASFDVYQYKSLFMR